MDKTRQIACVTGATGMVGSKIVRQLLLRGYRVRILSRRNVFDNPQVELFVGGSENEKILCLFLQNAHLLFHCAAELRNEAKMWDVNVLGTERLLKLAEKFGIKYLCYLSSVGVTGHTDLKWVDEQTLCNPQNAYEKSKWAAEQLVAHGINGCKTVILRPTNIIDEKRPGVLVLPKRSSFLDRLKVFLKGGECAHIVHAEDVAAAALYFISYPLNTPQCFIVSCDHEPMNTLAGLWALYKVYQKKRFGEGVKPVLHLPIIIPHLMRLLWRGRGNRGDVRYSFKRLVSVGFAFPLGIKGAVKQILLHGNE